MNDKSLGIEVAAAILTQDAIVEGEFTKYEFGKKDAASQNRCLEIISKYGGEVSEFCLSFPQHSLDGREYAAPQKGSPPPLRQDHLENGTAQDWRKL